MKIQKQISAFGILTTIFVIVFLALININHKQVLKNQEWVNHTGNVISEVDNIEVLVAGIESNTRGYVISDNNEFIRDIAKKKDSILRSFAKLKAWNNHSPDQYNDVIHLEALVSEKMKFNARIIEEHNRDRENGGKMLVKTLKGKLLMDQILASIEKIKQEESAILSSNISKNVDSLESNYSLQFISAVITFLVIMGILQVLNKGLNNRKEAELRLAESQSRMSAVLNSAKEAVILIKKDSTLVLINEYAKEMSIQHSGKELQEGMKFFDFFPEEKIPYYQAIFDKVIQGEVQIGDVQLNSPEGPRWYETVFYPVKNKKGIVDNICISTREITERLKYQEELLAAKKKAESAERLQETFLANMSHEIRTPMNGIVGMTDILSSTVLTNEQRNIVKTIKKSSDTLLFLINDILDLSKIKAGKLNIEKVPFEFNEVLDSVTTPFEIKAKFNNIQFEVKNKINFPLHIIGDQFRLIQILNNLLGNAIKFTKEGGVTLTIEEEKVSPKQIQLQFSVSDTGIGIEEDKLESIFKSFEQGTNSITREFGGTGLGLSITKKLIELQKGSISVESVYGKGTTFRFNIPYELAELKVKPVGMRQEPVDFTVLKGRKVLVVEDNEINQMVISQTLRKVGIDYTIANHGKEAVHILQGGKEFDLIIMDLHMPELDGYRTTTVIRNELNIHIPIIAMTASVLQDERNKCLQLGMNDYIAKPFDQAELFASISRLLGQNINHIAWERKIEDSVFDLQFLNELGDEKYTGEVLSHFLQTTPTALDSIQEAFSNRDPEAIFFTVHKLKSALGLLKINGMLNTCHLIESLTRDKILLVEHEWKQVASMLTDLQNQFKEVSPLIVVELSKRIAII
jgi:PAS domain S-box-containing protein